MNIVKLGEIVDYKGDKYPDNSKCINGEIFDVETLNGIVTVKVIVEGWWVEDTVVEVLG